MRTRALTWTLPQDRHCATGRQSMIDGVRVAVYAGKHPETGDLSWWSEIAWPEGTQKTEHESIFAAKAHVHKAFEMAGAS